jgi:hypothetical protein
MVQLSATRCNCNAILWVRLVSFAAITLCVASQRMFIVVSTYFVSDSVRKLLVKPTFSPPPPPPPPHRTNCSSIRRKENVKKNWPHEWFTRHFPHDGVYTNWWCMQNKLRDVDIWVLLGCVIKISLLGLSVCLSQYLRTFQRSRGTECKVTLRRLVTALLLTGLSLLMKYDYRQILNVLTMFIELRVEFC